MRLSKNFRSSIPFCQVVVLTSVWWKKKMPLTMTIWKMYIMN